MRHFEFEVLGVQNLPFTPGQFVSVIDRANGKEVTRPYSIASPRNGNRFSLCLNYVADGLVSPHLFDLEQGDEVEIGEPLGYFTLRRPDRHALFIATGTGVAPFRSILLDHLPKMPTRVALLFGARFEEALLYRKEFEELGAGYEQFRFLPTVTRPSAEWTGLVGRVQAHLDDAISVASGGDPAHLDVYICGMKEMVDEVRAQLKQRGFDRKQIIYEKYD